MWKLSSYKYSGQVVEDVENKQLQDVYSMLGGQRNDGQVVGNVVAEWLKVANQLQMQLGG